MRIAVIGAGPAGLYFSYLIKRRRPDIDISVFEQNPADATFGFGVVFSDRALEFLRGDDPETYDLVTPRMENWTDMQLDIDGTMIRIDGIGFSAIGRLDLLRLLQQQARSAGVELLFETKIDETADLDAFDLVVAADGAGSMIRTARQDAFATGVETLSNKFVWYGTDKPFETLTQTFRRNNDGVFNAHHYRYTPGMSTFIVETDAASWDRAGFAAMDEEATRAYCEAVFADTLEDHGLISNKSVWRDYLKISNEIWSAGNTVLVGDALRTAHFSIGSGTRLAMEDAIALDRALERALKNNEGDIPAALADYQATRRPVVDKLVAAADASALWYERFGEHMALDPWDMAWSYIQRSGRISAERLAKISPVFVARYEAARGR